jgi:hypothetical protein
MDAACIQLEQHVASLWLVGKSAEPEEATTTSNKTKQNSAQGASV